LSEYGFGRSLGADVAPSDPSVEGVVWKEAMSQPLLKIT
jgi:hypothetical protein